jgi:hypothetical protein
VAVIIGKKNQPKVGWKKTTSTSQGTIGDKA